jgi:hypothetical protein
LAGSCYRASAPSGSLKDGEFLELLTNYPFPIKYRRVLVSTLLHQSESLYGVLGVEPTLWMLDQILLPFQQFESGICCLSLWGALSDERPGLPL